jgi:hypothetical protein
MQIANGKTNDSELSGRKHSQNSSALDEFKFDFFSVITKYFNSAILSKNKLAAHISCNYITILFCIPATGHQLIRGFLCALLDKYSY